MRGSGGHLLSSTIIIKPLMTERFIIQEAYRTNWSRQKRRILYCIVIANLSLQEFFVWLSVQVGGRVCGSVKRCRYSVFIG